MLEIFTVLTDITQTVEVHTLELYFYNLYIVKWVSFVKNANLTPENKDFIVDNNFVDKMHS